MNKWQQIAESLKGAFGTITVIADGHEVSFHKGVYGEKLVIETWVDGHIKGAWMAVDDQGAPVHPEGRFYRPRKHRVYALKQHAKLKRVFGKKRADEMTALRIYMLDPTWNSPKTLVSHLKKSFPNLEVVQEDAPEEAEADLEALARPTFKREVYS